MNPNPASSPDGHPQDSFITPNQSTGASAAPAPQTPSVGVYKTERPIEPPYPLKPFIRKEDEAIIGNPEAIFELKLEGHLGCFYNRENTTKVATLVDVNYANMYGAAARTINEVIKQHLRISTEFETPALEAIANEHAIQLTNGVLVMTHLKLLKLSHHDMRVADRFRQLPKVPAPFEVLTPYALAISQLGKIRLSGMPNEVFLTPTAPPGQSSTFGCLGDHLWSPISYSRSVEYAKKLGLRFTSVDLTVKMGSSWWLYRPAGDNNAFKFECPFPEENFTENTAVLAALFANNATDGFNNPLIDLLPLGTNVFATMLRSPMTNLSLNVYYAIVERKEIDYKVVN